MLTLRLIRKKKKSDMVKASAKTYFRNAQDLFRSGKLKEARKLLQEILKTNPKQLDSLLLIGQCFYGEGKYEDALEHFEKGVAVKPDGINLLILKAQTLVKLKRLESAAQVLRTGFETTSNLQFKLNLGIVKSQMGSYKEAIELLAANELAKLGNDTGWLHRAKSLAAIGRNEEAGISYQECLKISPRNKAALNNLANLYQRNQAFAKAIKLYETLINYFPEEGMAYNNMAGLQEKLNNLDQAVSLYEKATEVSPELSMAWYNRAHLLGKRLNQHAKSLEICNEGLKKGKGEFLEPLRFLQILSKQQLNDWSSHEEDQTDLNSILQNYLNSQSPKFEIVPFDLSFSKIDGTTYRRVAEKYAKGIAEKAKSTAPKIPYNHTLSEGKIKVGYYSSEFRKHAGGFLVRKLFEYHDSSEFEVHAFSLVHTEDFVNKDIQESVDYYHDVSKLSAPEIASLINRSGIDVLIALGGYNSFMKIEVLAMRPAPIQMMMIGSQETTGAPFVDFVFSDTSLIDEELRRNFSENVITLPSPLLMNCELPQLDAKETTREDHQLPAKGFVFASFNHPQKVDPETFDCWCEILKSVPDSVLWLYDAGSKDIQDITLSNASERGIESDRIVFAAPKKIEEHWERVKHADLFLDTFICNAHFTGVEVLRSGKPILTKRGDSHNSRLCSSLLHFARLPELVTRSSEEYIKVAISLAQDVEGLKKISKKLSSKKGNVLFDSELQIKYLEKALKLVLHEFNKNGQFKDLIVKNTLKFNLFS